MAPWQKILCAIDYSEDSRHALELAADLARAMEAELTVVHVREEPCAAREAAPSASGATERPEEVQLSEWRAEAEQRAGRGVRSELAQGQPGNVLVRLADAGNFDVIVMGKRGRTGLKRLVMGSVAEKVARDASCTVVVARPAPWRGD